MYQVQQGLDRFGKPLLMQPSRNRSSRAPRSIGDGDVWRREKGIRLLGHLRAGEESLGFFFTNALSASPKTLTPNKGGAGGFPKCRDGSGFPGVHNTHTCLHTLHYCVVGWVAGEVRKRSGRSLSVFWYE